MSARRSPRRFSGPLLTLFALFIFVPMSFAQDTDGGSAGALLGDVQRSLSEEQSEQRQLRERSAALAEDLLKIRRELVYAADLVRQHERSLSDLEARVAALDELEREKALILDKERANFTKVLHALERLARYPPEAMIALPNSPGDTVRTAILLRTIVPRIERRAARLRHEIESLARARQRAAERRVELDAARVSLARESAGLEKLMAEKKALKAQTDSERTATQARVAFLRNEARNLRDLVARIEKDRRKREAAIPPPPKKPVAGEDSAVETAALRALPSVPVGTPIADRRGQLPMPAVGIVSGRFGETNKNGVKLRGIRIATRPRAQVVAPHEGAVVYVGEFRGYGQLLIIEHGGGYHTLLVGMARIDSEMGQHVLSGEPVGVMSDGRADEPVLYVELRQGGKPINPLLWIAARDSVPQG